MAKALFYRLFGLGKIPVNYLTRLQAEEIVLLDEGIKGSVTLRNFHRPGKSSAFERRWFIASIALTKISLLSLNGINPLIDVPLIDSRLPKMKFLFEETETLCIIFDAGLFQRDWTGTIEYRFRTAQAQQFLDILPG